MNIPTLSTARSLLRLHPPSRPDWHRAVRPRFATKATALATRHTRTVPGRFNDGTLARPAFPVLYLAETPIVALFEVQALVGSPVKVIGIHPMPGAGAWTILTVNLRLQKVADLTKLHQQAVFSTNAQELTGDWRAYDYRKPGVTSVGRPYKYPAPTQELGAALYKVPGLEGFEAISARVPHQRTLVVFPDKLRDGSEVKFINDDGEEWDIKDIDEGAGD